MPDAIGMCKMRGSAKSRKDKLAWMESVAWVRQDALTSRAILLLIILLIALSLSLLFYYGPSAIAGSDNFFYNEAAHLLYTKGLQSLAWAGVASIKYVVIGGAGFFQLLLGANRLSAALFDILLLLGLVFMTYRIGREVSGPRAGVLAAYLFAIFPLAVTQASGAGDDIPMTFMATLTVLLVLLARKDGKNSPLMYLISGVTAVTSFFASPEGILILIPVLMIMAYDTIRGRRVARRVQGRFRPFLSLVAGILIAGVFFVFVGYIESGSATYVISQEVNYYSNYCSIQSQCNTINSQSFSGYLNILLPFNLVERSIQSFRSGTVSPLASSLNPASGYIDAGYNIGFYFYFAILFAAALAVFRKREIVLPLVLIVPILLYLSFGTMGLLGYERIVLVYPRYTLIFFPAVCVLLGIGISELIGIHTRRGARKWACQRIPYYALAALFLAFMTILSVYSVMYMDFSWYKTVYNLIGAGSYINSLPQNSDVFTLDENRWSLVQFTDYSHTFYYYGSINTASCGSIPTDSYIVVVYNQTLQQQCDLAIAYKTENPPAWMSQYDLYDPITVDYSNLTVYRKQ